MSHTMRFGHRELLVAPDGKRIAVIGSRESDTHDEAYEILLFTSEGKFIRRLAYNYTRGYDPKYGLKSTEGFYIVSAIYGLDGSLYIRTEQVNLDGTGRTQRIDVYDTEGVYLTAVSEAYTRATAGLPEAIQQYDDRGRQKRSHFLRRFYGDCHS